MRFRNSKGVNLRRSKAGWSCYRGQCSDCVAWMHSLKAAQTDMKWNVTSLLQGKDLLTARINTGPFSPVIKRSLSKSAQWIPQEFSNALLPCVYFPIYFTRVSPVHGGSHGGIYFRWAVLTRLAVVEFNDTLHVEKYRWYHSRPWW